MLIILLKFSLNQRSPPPPPPPTTPAVFDAGTIASVFTRLHELHDKFQGRRTPPPENVGSDRRSPTAGPSDIARPNPLAQVADSAPQGPDVAPGPSMATHVPPASGPSHHDAPSSGESASARVGEDDWEHVRSGVAEFRPQSDFVTNWSRPTRRLSSLGRSSTSVAPVGGRLQITIIVIWIFSTQNTTSLA